jgi:hypothetical protein
VPAKGGTIFAVQDVAAELNPDPLYVKTEFMVPEEGVSATLVVTLNADRTTSLTGVPLTCTVQLMFVVA